MIDIPTVFILGAGASVPYGYPTGAGLRASIIRDFCNNLQRLLVHNKTHGPKRTQYMNDAKAFVDVFKNSSVESIDKFLSLNSSFTDIGKIAIALSMLNAESTHNFYEETSLIDAKQNWYKLLFNHMTSELQKPSDFVNFRENRVAFITFNYDRSLDHFLYVSLLNAFFDKHNEFESSIKDYIPFPIIHVYGQVDKIKWHGGSDYEAARFSFAMVDKLSHNIRVIGEKSNDLKDEIARIIARYKRIFFLGLGYAKENMDSIGMPKSLNIESDVYGTAYKMTEKEIENVRDVFRQNFRDQGVSKDPQIEDKTCYELLREYL